MSEKYLPEATLVILCSTHDRKRQANITYLTGPSSLQPSVFLITARDLYLHSFHITSWTPARITAATVPDTHSSNT